jgi:hypothetical protein
VVLYLLEKFPAPPPPSISWGDIGQFFLGGGNTKKEKGIKRICEKSEGKMKENLKQKGYNKCKIQAKTEHEE